MRMDEDERFERPGGDDGADGEARFAREDEPATEPVAPHAAPAP